MKKILNEATVVMAKCEKSKQAFGIRTEKMSDNVWHCTWAFQINEKAASNEGYSSKMISGRVDIDNEYPGCPYCGVSGWAVCGKCGKLSCYGGSTTSTCSWCGNTAVCTDSDTFDISGGDY